MLLSEIAMRRKLAVIVKGNPKYLNDPKVKKMADQFYSEIKKILEDKGYTVEMDPGKPHTLPDESATVWIGHSRGIDRLQFAPKGVKTIELQTEDHKKTFENNDERGTDLSHYELSEKDQEALASL